MTCRLRYSLIALLIMSSAAHAERTCVPDRSMDDHDPSQRSGINVVTTSVMHETSGGIHLDHICAINHAVTSAVVEYTPLTMARRNWCCPGDSYTP